MTAEEAIEIIKNELVFESGVIREALEVIERAIEKANNKKVGMIFHNDGGFEYICTPATSAQRQHAACPLTLAMRQKILGRTRSLCPQRPICCPASRSALSCAYYQTDSSDQYALNLRRD